MDEGGSPGLQPLQTQPRQSAIAPQGIPPLLSQTA
jgi:hypothetical protein